MFDNEDTHHIFINYPPPTEQNGLPSLVIAASGQGFITLRHIQAEFQRRMTEETKQVPIANLANDMDIELPIILQLIDLHPHLALLGIDCHNVIPKAERDVIQKNLSENLLAKPVSRKEFALQNGIDPKSLEFLLGDIDEELVHHDDLVCTVSYDKELSFQTQGTINSAINNIADINLWSSDFAELPGSPPKWLVLRHFERNLKESPELKDQVLIRDIPDGICVLSKQFRARTIKNWTRYLVTGEEGYVDLHEVLKHTKCLYDTISDIVHEYQKLPNLEVIDAFAISEVYFEKLAEQKLKALHWDEAGAIDVAKGLGEKFQVPEYHQMGVNPFRKFPERLYSHLERKVEQHIDTAIAQKPDSNYHRLGTIILTNERYALEREKVLETAKEAATSQWQYLKDEPDHDLKFTAPTNMDATDLDSKLQSTLCTEKAIQKDAESNFWTAIANLEDSNETAFQAFWTERVDSRARAYNAGLSCISDAKLREQLASLFAAYMQKELVPESITKARAQHLVLSRKTKKNVARLETALSAAKCEAEAVLSTLDRFNKKQGIEGVEATDQLEDARKGMVQDMVRRMQKLQKGSDGPVLFLTLVVLLFDKYHAGLVYATGKYAPKLLKLLKEKMEAEQYARVEKWKEAAKSSSLTAEDREEMRVMAAS